MQKQRRDLCAYFYPRPPGGGRRPKQTRPPAQATRFLSTPSGWRATPGCHRSPCFPLNISIHALRVEGDSRHFEVALVSVVNFYPRPPGGGRPSSISVLTIQWIFLSTPSGWRATHELEDLFFGLWISIHALRVEGDPSTFFTNLDFLFISIHTLRVEGDSRITRSSRPESGISIHTLRVEGDLDYQASALKQAISIHTLRVEGDLTLCFQRALTYIISIHTLRVEGDRRSRVFYRPRKYFYPHPPGGGRHLLHLTPLSDDHFYPHPPGGGRRRTCHVFVAQSVISIHTLRVEGDVLHFAFIRKILYFYPHPPGGGRHFA